MSCVVRGFIDLHCHWVANIDDGVRDHEASLALVRGLQNIGFDTIVATPHMRPGMFDNTADDLRKAYGSTMDALGTAPKLRPTPFPGKCLRLSGEAASFQCPALPSSDSGRGGRSSVSG